MKERYKVQLHNGRSWNTALWFSEFEPAEKYATSATYDHPMRILDGRRCVWYRCAIV